MSPNTNNGDIYRRGLNSVLRNEVHKRRVLISIFRLPYPGTPQTLLSQMCRTVAHEQNPLPVCDPYVPHRMPRGVSVEPDEFCILFRW